jgi:glyoxylase-like metal-dependent hydrolase (beta-lactamase superfamily II)
MRKSGLGAAPADTHLMFGGFWATAADGFRYTSPRILRPEPGIQVAQGYDFADLAFITTSDGVIAIDAGTTQDRVKAALGDLDLPADAAISHLILTHAQAYQQSGPFKFLIYAELAGAQIGPVQ